MNFVSRTALLSIPLKQPAELQWTPYLLDYIYSSYGQDIAQYREDCHLLDSLRKHALNQSSKSPFAIEDLSIYYSQLTFLSSRFPLNMDLNIGWLPIFSQEKPDIMRNLSYEKACVLYRIAGAYSELGCSQNQVSTEGIRKACQFFQNAAGCLAYIKSDLIPEFREKPSQDFELIDALIALMMAQAHECIWLKAVMEHMKHGTIARLAFKVADLYDLVSDTEAIPEYWKIYADTKHNYFKAESQYQKANEAISSGRYGEEISRLHLAQSSNNIASQHITQHPHFMIQSFVDRVAALKHAIERDLVRAEKDNDVIYMETVPEPNQLAPILRSDMVKPVLPSFVSDPSYWLVLADRPNDKLFIKRPLFEKLLPFAVHQAVSIYADNKDYIIKTEIIGKNQELKADRQRLLEGLELPYSLDKIDSLPKSLIDHAEEVQDEGGIQSVFDMLQKIQTMSQKASDLINEGFNALEEENEQDAEMSRQFGKLWSRPSSVALTHHLLTLGSQYNDTIQAAQKADRIVQAKVNTWGKAISMLSKPVNEIQQHLPSLSENDPSHHGIVQLLSQLRSKVEDLAKESEQQVNLEKNALSLKDDISQSLLKKMDELTKGSLLVKLEPEQFAQVIEQHLKFYLPFQNHIQAHVLSQAGLLHSVSELHARLVLMTSDIPLLSKREKAICNLELAFAKFKEIRINLVEGIKFYSQYTDTLTQFRDDCVEFALARKLEVTELAKSVAPSRLLLLKK